MATTPSNTASTTIVGANRPLGAAWPFGVIALMFAANQFIVTVPKGNEPDFNMGSGIGVEISTTPDFAVVELGAEVFLDGDYQAGDAAVNIAVDAIGQAPGTYYARCVATAN